MTSPLSASWPVQEAKAKFSELLETCIAKGPQMVTKRGVQAAVLVPVAEWRRLLASARPSLKELLVAETPRSELVVRTRGTTRRRNVIELR
jgi:antitoxin Phd